jgi:predicted  nucleic acid-binding Zn-ribbon protein
MKELTISQQQQLEWRKVNRELSTYKKKYNKQRQEAMNAMARAHELKLRAKSAEGSVIALTKKLNALNDAAAKVTWFDWSDNDVDSVLAIDALRELVTPN